MSTRKILFTIPFAGGSDYSIKSLIKNFNRECTVFGLEPPGRGRRIGDPLINNINELVDDLFEVMEPVIDQYDQFYLYGHSMGALLSYLLCHKFKELKGDQPSHLFVSGCGGPSSREQSEKYLLPSDEFRSHLVTYGGIVPEVLENETVMDFFEPILRADFEVVECYLYKERSKLDIPITCFFGSDEDLTMEEVNLWQIETIHPIEVFEYPGNHFFIFQHYNEVFNVIEQKIINNNILIP